MYAILLAGGIGRRTGLNIPKQFFQIKKKRPPASLPAATPHYHILPEGIYV